MSSVVSCAPAPPAQSNMAANAPLMIPVPRIDFPCKKFRRPATERPNERKFHPFKKSFARGPSSNLALHAGHHRAHQVLPVLDAAADHPQQMQRDQPQRQIDQKIMRMSHEIGGIVAHRIGQEQ